jgi:hypothetical protein
MALFGLHVAPPVVILIYIQPRRNVTEKQTAAVDVYRSTSILLVSNLQCT